MQATAVRDNLNKANAMAQSELLSVVKEVQQKKHRIEFVDAVLLLFSDISKIPPIIGLEIAATLDMIFKARLNPAAIYPIDYSSLRDKIIGMLEQALGKLLVPRSTHDDMLKLAVERHDDLMLDKLGKMEAMHIQTNQAKEALEQLTKDKLLPVALNLHAKGFIVLYKCRGCRRTLAAYPAGINCSIAKCSYCGASNP